MNGSSLLFEFTNDERGAVSVDWTLVTAACVGIGLATTNLVASAVSDLTHDIRIELETDVLANPFDDTSTGQDPCANLYLDPAADPNAADMSGESGACTVGG